MTLRSCGVDALFALLELGSWLLDTPRRVRRHWSERRRRRTPPRRP